MSTNWIPIDQITIHSERTYEVTWNDSSVSVTQGNLICKGTALAAREYDPDPYIPPSPTRHEYHFDGHPAAYSPNYIQSRCNAVVYAGPPVSGGVHVREVLPGDPPPAILDAIVKLHEDKTVGQHWLITAIERVAAGEPEIDVMRDYRYLYDKHKDATAMKLAQDMRNAAWLMRFQEGIVQGSPFVGESIAKQINQLLDAILKPTPKQSTEPTPEQIDSACLSFRHNFGLLGLWEKESIRADARDWFIAWRKELSL